MSTRPTLLFVHGSWHSASTWDKVVALLEPTHKCIKVSLPSGDGTPSAGLGEDVAAVRNVIVAEMMQGNDVVLVMHSYGGLVGASAIKGLTAKGSTGRVIGLAMLATGFAMTGLSFIDGFGGNPPTNIWKIDEKSGFAVLVAEPRELFYHDLPEEEGRQWVANLTTQSSKALMEGGEHAYSGWKDVPVWYLSTTEDHALPAFAQKMFVQLAKDAGGNVTLKEVESSHSPMLSKPKESFDFILEAVAAFV